MHLKSDPAKVIEQYGADHGTSDGCPSCAMFLMLDLDTQRVYRLHAFTKALLIRPDVAYCIAGKVNSADKLYLVIESVRPDTKHSRLSTLLVRMNFQPELCQSFTTLLC